MSKFVHVVLSDRGWILERLAAELCSRLSYISYGLEVDAGSSIQYYNTYGCRRGRVSPIEVALFTHREVDAAASARFLSVAREVDLSIAMSRTTDELLAAGGIAEHCVISPGVDLDRFAPRLKIAIVGRTYHTERKGEALINAVMDIPDIDWHFAGEGWPGPALSVPDADLPAFYRSMDYVLVPALSESGSMCVLEALASGVPVIGSAVGWVPDFPHIPFATGDAGSLRQVLLGVRQKKFALREAVSSLTWDHWAEEHDKMFHALTAKLGASRSVGTVPPPQQVENAPPTTTIEIQPAETFRPIAGNIKSLPADIDLIFDVTTNIQHAGTRSGIIRVEFAIASTLCDENHRSIRFVAWAKDGHFYEVPRQFVLKGAWVEYLACREEVPSERAVFRPNSRLIVTGGSWLQNNLYAESVSQFAREHDVELTVLVHDLTVCLFPFWFPKGFAETFSQSLSIVLGSADRLLIYSDNTRRDIESFASKRNLNIGVFGKIRLAAEIDAEGMRAAAVESARASAVRAQFSHLHYILVIGAIRPHKNHALLYETWLILREQMGDDCPHLVIVGSISWGGAATARALREDSRINDLVHILEGIDDSALDWLYRHCLCTVYPSLYEGWGLPVGESLRYGKVCLTSNAASMPEIAPSLTELLDPRDRQAWAAKIQFYATSHAAREAREAQICAEYRPTLWRDTARDLIAALSAPHRKTKRALYTPAVAVSLTDRTTGVSFKWGGWYPCESWGSWASERRCRLRLELTEPPAGDLVFSAVVRMFASKSVRRCMVSANGTKIADWSIAVGKDELRGAVIPAALVGADGGIDLTFESDYLQRVIDIDPKSTDPRSLGFGMAKFVLQTGSQSTDPWRLLGATPVNAGELPHGEWYGPEDKAFKAAFLSPLEIDPLWGTVAEGGYFGIRVSAPRPLAGLRVRAILRAPAHSDQPVKVTVLANGIDVGTAELRNADPVVTEWIVPSTALARHDPATLVLLSQDRGSHPAYANGKLFAFSVYSLLVTAADAIENIPVRPLAPRVDNLPSSTAGRRIEKVAASVWSSLPLGGGKRHVEAARDAMRRKDWQKAVGHYAAAVKAAPSRAAVWVQYGHALKESGDCATAETAYQKALSLAPDVADTYVQLGHVTKLMGLLDAAVTYYRRAIELDPLRADAAAELDVLAPQSNPLAAVQLLKMTRPGTQPRASA